MTDRLQSLLAAAPGPSPWYLRGAPHLVGKHANYHWRDAGNDRVTTGKTVLYRHRDKAIVGVLDMYCWVRPLGGARLLVWHRTKPGEGGPSGSAADAGTFVESDGSVIFRIIDADRLERVMDLSAACKALEPNLRPAWLQGGDEASITHPTSLDDGSHEAAIPAAFHELDEILALVHSTAPSPPAESASPHLRIWSLRPKESVIEVIPQDWFNISNIDFSYEWVTRLARDPESGHIIGDGIRLAPFELDATGRQVSRWL